MGYFAKGPPRYHNIRAEYFLQVIRSMLDSELTIYSFLDVGSGNDILTNYFIHYFNPQKVVCIDLKVKSLKETKKNLKNSNISLIQADAQYLPIRDNIIDYVQSFSTIQYVRLSGKMLVEMYRVLKKESLFILQFPNRFILIEPHIGLHLSFIFPQMVKDSFARKRPHWPEFYVELSLIKKHHYNTARVFRCQFQPNGKFFPWGL